MLLSLLHGVMTYMFEINYVKHANITQQCHNKFVSIKTGGGPLPAPYWVTGVLLYSRQKNKEHGREGKDEKKHSERRRRGDDEYGSHRGTRWERWRQTCCSVLAAFQRQRCSLWTNKNTGQLNITFPFGAWALWRCAGLKRAGEGMLCPCEMHTDLQGSPPEGEGGMDHTRVRSALVFD